MAKRSPIIWALLVMLLMFLSVYGCSTIETTTSSAQTPTTKNKPTETTTTPPHDNELGFERLYVPILMKEEEIPVQIHVMTSKESPLPDVIAEISAEGQLTLEGIEYVDDFILFVFTGKQTFYAPGNDVTKIYQNDNTIYIEQNFPKKTDPTVLPAFYYGKYVIRVSKDNMTHFGEITFILLDQDGKERARAVYEIPE